MKRLWIGLATLSLVCGLIAIPVAISQPAWSIWSGEAPLEISPSVQELGTTSRAEVRVVVFRVTNRSRDRIARLIGATNTCGPLGCITVKGLPMAIPPGSSILLEVEYEGVTPGRSARVARIFTDSPTQAEIPFTIVADVVAAGGSYLESERTP